MVTRVGWLPTGTQSAEDTRAATGLLIAPDGLLLPRAGVLPTVSTSTPFALTSTGSLSCSVGPGVSIVCPAQSTYQGGYPATVDASGTGLPTVSFAAGGSLARTDVIYIQVQDTAEDGSGFTRPVVGVVQGTNGGGVPNVPSGANALWQIPVPANATNINFATAVAAYRLTTTAGGVIPANTSGVPANAYVGQVRARTDRTGVSVPGPLEVWDGTTWNPAVPASMPRGIVAAPATNSGTGTATSGTTDTMDTVFGTYPVTLTAGRRYRVVLTNTVLNGSVAGDEFAVRVRDSGSASTPTTASTAVVDSLWTCVSVTGSGGRMTLQYEDTFLCGVSGTHTLAIFAQRVFGSGVLTMLAPAASSATGQRKLYVEDIGNV